jgi:hypothetical protein
MKPCVGQTLASTVDAAPMVDPRGPEAGTAGITNPGQMGGSQFGKRYADRELGVELQYTRSGLGTPAVSGARRSSERQVAAGFGVSAG